MRLVWCSLRIPIGIHIYIYIYLIYKRLAKSSTCICIIHFYSLSTIDNSGLSNDT